MAHHSELLDLKRWDVNNDADLLWILQDIIAKYKQHQELENHVMIILEARHRKESER